MNQKEFVHEISRLIEENPDYGLHFLCDNYTPNHSDKFGSYNREITKVDVANYKKAIIVYLE